MAILVDFIPELDTPGSGRPHLILAPVVFTFYLYDAMRSEIYSHPMLNTVVFRVLFMLLPILALYTGLSYLLLTMISRWRNKAVIQDSPPPPPLFMD